MLVIKGSENPDKPAPLAPLYFFSYYPRSLQTCQTCQHVTCADAHPLPLSISSQCSRLMELLIGEKTLVLWFVAGSTPALSALAQRRLTGFMCSHLKVHKQQFLFFCLWFSLFYFTLYIYTSIISIYTNFHYTHNLDIKAY